MQAFQQRVVDEKTELDNKRKALVKFFDNENFYKLDEIERSRLERQYGVMNNYAHILGERIKAFKLA